MKILLLIISFSCLTINSFAQNFSKAEQHQIDSLNTILNNSTVHDTAIVSAYVELSEILFAVDPDTLIILCKKAQKIAEKGLINTTNSLIKLSFQKTIADALNNIGYVYMSQGEISKALDYYHQTIKIYEVIEDKEGIATNLNNIGVIYDSQGNIHKALEYYHQALKILEEIGDIEGVASILNNIGNIHDSQGDIPKALDYHHQSLKIQEEIGDKEGTAISLNNIGYIYDSQGDIKNSLDYYHKSLKLFKEIEDKEGVAYCLNNIGYVYDKQGNTDKSLEYYHESLKIREEIGDKKGNAQSLNNIGGIYKSQGDILKALDYYHQSLKIREEIGDKEGQANSLNNIGEMEFAIGHIKLAKTNFIQALSLSQELGYPKYISRAAAGLNEVALEENNYKVAYDMYKLHIVMRDSINNEKTYKASIQQQTKYEYEKQKALDDLKAEKLIAIEKEKREKEKQEKEKQKIITYAAFGGIILIGLFLAFVFNRLRVTKKQKLVIEEQKKQVEIAHKKTEQQKEIIEETHKEITDSINYAKRLQDAILPSISDIDEHLPNNFVLFQPKDVVSGDFYWFEHKNNISFLAAADCTGHGVPGAMVSVVCSNALHRTVNEFGITEPSKILDKTRELVIETFAKSGEEVKDGMDIALCTFSDNKVVFSGANNPLWIVRHTKALTTAQLEHRSTCIIDELALIEFKANKQPIGLYAGMQPFSQTEIDLIEGDTLYFFTDGFADQFGGKKGKKFKYKPFKRTLIENSTLTMEAQKGIIQKTFNSWKGNLEQVDDVCIIGVKV